ncbi:MAG: DUF2997 domain-containing protein [Spirochaetales bacterium]|nr:DUF2997 domain-containing protein [Spirochaetales bacterium]
MAERHDIDITITSTGEVSLTVSGIDGPRCVELTKDIENDLGEVLSKEKTSEYFNPEKKVKNKIEENR